MRLIWDLLLDRLLIKPVEILPYLRATEQLKCLCIPLNTFNDVSPLVPFGGVRESGLGRENGFVFGHEN
ncbi:unnamed protein product [Caenorhabditis nigoni]